MLNMTKFKINNSASCGDDVVLNSVERFVNAEEFYGTLAEVQTKYDPELYVEYGADGVAVYCNAEAAHHLVDGCL